MRTWIAGALTLSIGLAATAVRAQDASPPNPERLRLAEQVMQAAGGGANMAALVSKTIDAAAAQTVRTGTPQQQAKVAELQTYLKERLTYYLPRILEAGATVYAREFTDAQLRDMLAFYQSPTGRALQAKLPQVSAESLQAATPVLHQLQRDMLGHLCTASPCTAEQKQAIANAQAAVG